MAKYCIQKSILTPKMFRKRFGYNQEDYDRLILMGLPTIKIGSLVRLDIDEVKEWALDKHITLTDSHHCLSRKDLINFLSIDKKTTNEWIRLGLKVHRKTVRGIVREYFHVDEVMEFLESYKEERV